MRQTADRCLRARNMGVAECVSRPWDQRGSLGAETKVFTVVLLFTWFKYVIYFIFILLFGLTMPLVGLGSLTGDQTHAPHSENTRVLSTGLPWNSLYCLFIKPDSPVSAQGIPRSTV